MSSFLSDVNKEAWWLPFVGFVLLQNHILIITGNYGHKNRPYCYVLKASLRGFICFYLHMESCWLVTHFYLNLPEIKCSISHKFDTYQNCISFLNSLQAIRDWGFSAINRWLQGQRWPSKHPVKQVDQVFVENCKKLWSPQLSSILLMDSLHVFCLNDSNSVLRLWSPSAVLHKGGESWG